MPQSRRRLARRAATCERRVAMCTTRPRAPSSCSAGRLCIAVMRQARRPRSAGQVDLTFDRRGRWCWQRRSRGTAPPARSGDGGQEAWAAGIPYASLARRRPWRSALSQPEARGCGLAGWRGGGRGRGQARRTREDEAAHRRETGLGLTVGTAEATHGRAVPGREPRDAPMRPKIRGQRALGPGSLAHLPG